MRAIAIDANEHGGLGALLDEMHQVCAQVCARSFAGLGWQVQIEQGREGDEYDALDPTYILVLTDRSDLVVCACLLPTLKASMLSRRFPLLLTSETLRGNPTMIESSRFCVDTRGEGREGRFPHEANLTMFAGTIEWSTSNGYTEITNFVPARGLSANSRTP